MDKPIELCFTCLGAVEVALVFDEFPGGRGQLKLKASSNGENLGSLVIASGPVDPIRDFAAEKISLQEMRDEVLKAPLPLSRQGGSP